MIIDTEGIGQSRRKVDLLFFGVPTPIRGTPSDDPQKPHGTGSSLAFPSVELIGMDPIL